MRLRTSSVIVSSLLIVPAALALVFTAPAHAATSAGGDHASATSIGALDVPQMHTASVCKNVKSSGNWNGTICAIVNLDDATGWTTGQALITYSIKSGTLKIVSAKSLYTNVSTPICCFQYSVRTNPSKNVGSGRSSFLSNDWYGPASSQYMIQAVVVNPCMSWTNGQRACYIGTLKSGFSGLTGL
jgi:hypothetical protein